MRTSSLSAKSAIATSGYGGEQLTVNESSSPPDNLIKAACVPNDVNHTPRDSFLRVSASGSAGSNGTRVAPDRGCDSEVAFEVLKCNSAQSRSYSLEWSSQQLSNKQSSLADHNRAQTIAQHLADGYSARKQVCVPLILRAA